MSDTLSAPGGLVNFETNERILSADMDRIGKIALQSLTSMLAWLYRDQGADAPGSGFPGDDCAVSYVSGTTVRIAKGIGFYYDSAETDAFGMHYKPIVVAAADDEALGAPDANPRIDLVCLAPATTDDESEGRLYKDPSDGSVGVTATNKRTRLSYAVQVVAGTAAVTPSAPAVPSGYIALAEVLVEAGPTLTITDRRTILALGQFHAPDPHADYLESFVPGSITELAVTESSPAAMSVEVATGVAVIKSAAGTRRYRYQATTLVIAAADPSDPRMDVIVADDDGTVKVLEGVPNAVPVPQAIGDGQVGLATVTVAAAVATVVTANIADVRKREPIGTDQLRAASVTAAKVADDAIATDSIQDDAVTTAKIDDDAVTGAKLSVTPIRAILASSNGGTTTATVTITLVDIDGNAVAQEQYLVVEAIDTPASAFAATATGQVHAGETTNKVLAQTNASGELVLTHTGWGAATAVNWYVITPVRAPDEADTGSYGYATMKQITTT